MAKNFLKLKNFESRVIDAIWKCDAEPGNRGRILKAQNRIRTFESIRYSEYDLRGLSKAEKAFMCDNDMRSYYDCRDYSGRMHRYYIFIKKNATTGKKQLYAYEKTQWMRPNGQELGSWNYQYWLTINTSNGKVTKFNYEFHHSSILCFCWPFV
jgi:hypothetical protein